MSSTRRSRLSLLPWIVAALAVSALLPAPPAWPQSVEPDCPEHSEQPVPRGFDGCAALEAQVEDTASYMGPQGFKLDAYEEVLADFFGKYCHRNAAAGWVPDKRVRDTGPYVSLLQANGTWADPAYYGTHQPVVIWYNPKMLDWLRRNRPAEGPPPAELEVIPDGAVMVKEMYPAPAARCDRFPPEHLVLPASTGVALMIRDNTNARDGWFWGAWWNGFEPDWPAKEGNGLAAMGFGAYCMNCHASAADHLTFADLRNVRGEPGSPNVYLSQNFLFENRLSGGTQSRHRSAIDTSDDPEREQEPLPAYNPAFLLTFPTADPPTAASVRSMPSQTYDHTWVPGGGPTVASEFVTSDQCLGCHDAGSTGLQFDMTEPSPRDAALLNLSPYGSWRTSPMGLGGRDPIFFAQLASETETFHPTLSEPIQNVCLGCHGIQGQRQFGIDRVEAGEDCGNFLRRQLDAIPYPADPAKNPDLASAPYGALGRDGIACSACHHMVLTEEEIAKVANQPQNHCVEERQQFLNPENTGFARTFTGSFFVGPPGELYGPFTEPKTKPMEHALNMQPLHSASIQSSEVCGTCHTVHLPVYGTGGEPLGFTYEQTTYPEWAFSDYRTGTLPGGGELPAGAGSRAQSCQGCHMRSAAAKNGLFQSKIASIQEYRNFPATENTLPGDDIDLAVRDGFARHTLVGLNVFFIEMAQQFPDVLGIRTQDPMMVGLGLDPVLLTERRMLEQAATGTAEIEVTDISMEGSKLLTTVTVTSRVGHKLPSGVGFRRAFLRFSLLDGDGKVLWASGRTDGAGAIVDRDGEPVAGELWWAKDCSERLPGTPHQPHFQTITRQDQAQIYQELVTSPAPVADPRCGFDATPGGRLTTSFLSICGHVKDNRLLPHGFLDLEQRVAIAAALGAGADLAKDSGPYAVGDDPDYVHGGEDSITYEIDLAGVSGKPAAVEATLYYQAMPPFFLQDRFCTSKSADTDRLYYLAGHLDLAKSPAEGWKLEVVSSGKVEVGR